MAKKQKRRKKSPKSKAEKLLAIKFAQETKTQTSQNIQTQRRDFSLLVHLSQNPKFVGAMQWMLRGYFACTILLGILFAVPFFGMFYEETMIEIASYLPKNSFPPKTYIPGYLTPYVLFLIVAIFTFIGYRKGEVPPEIEKNPEPFPLKERIILFVVCFSFALFFGFFSTKGGNPDATFYQIITNPMLVVYLIIMMIVTLYYCFSRQQSKTFLTFVLYSAIAIFFTVFLIGMMIYTIVNSLLYFLNR